MTLHRGPGPGRGPRDLRQPRALGSTRSGWRSSCGTRSRPRPWARAWSWRSIGSGADRSRGTSPTSWCGRCAWPSRPSGDPPGLRLACHNAIPHARGSARPRQRSSAGWRLPARWSPAAGSGWTTTHCSGWPRIEGHPDNVAPALFGGFVISGREEDCWYAVRSPVDSQIVAAAFVPPTRCRPRSRAACCPPRSRTPMPPPTPGGPPCSWRRSRSPTSSAGDPRLAAPGVPAVRRCPPRSSSWTAQGRRVRSVRLGCRPDRAGARRLDRGRPVPSPAAVPVGWSRTRCWSPTGAAAGWPVLHWAHAVLAA